MKSHKNRKMSPTVRHKYKYFYSTVQRAKCRRQKFHFCRLPFDLRPRNVKLNLSNIWSSPHQNTLQGNRHSFFITHHLTPPVVRIPSLTVSFSVKDASAVRRMILKTRARKWQAFSEAVVILQMWFSERKNAYQLSLVTPLFQSVQVWPGLHLPSLWWWRTIPRTQWWKKWWLPLAARWHKHWWHLPTITSFVREPSR